MEKVRLAVYSEDKKPFVTLLRDKYKPEYTREIGDSYMFVFEHVNLFASSRCTFTIIIERIQDGLIFDIIGIGGRTRLFSVPSNYAYLEVRDIANLIIDYCNQNGIKGKQVKGESTM